MRLLWSKKKKKKHQFKYRIYWCPFSKPDFPLLA